MTNKNIRIAKQLVKIAKCLVASGYRFPETAEEHFANIVKHLSYYNGLEEVDKEVLEQGKEEIYDDLLATIKSEIKHLSGEEREESEKVLKDEANVKNTTERIVWQYLLNHGTRQMH